MMLIDNTVLSNFALVEELGLLQDYCKDQGCMTNHVFLVKRLGTGEASCLAIAMRRKYDLLSDDMAVRKIALREGIRLSGSIGVLIDLIRKDRIRLETGNKILRDFIVCGYFSPVDRLNEFL